MRHPIAAALVILFALSSAVAQEVRAPSDARPTLDDLVWLAGSWHGEGLGGEIEEHWTLASGGTMLGVFRLVVDDKIRVIEYVLIAQEEDRIAYRFKHFRTDYTTWEDDRPLEFTVPDQNAPRRITYRLTDGGDLVALVSASDEEGQLSDRFEIRFTRG
jgi:hypothetical protein